VVGERKDCLVDWGNQRIFADMKVEIEEYRGFIISFNTDAEEFSGVSDRYDTEFSSKSFASAKSKVDEYIKANMDFKPFVVVNKSGEKKKIVGIRKDKKFMYEEKNGEKAQFSTHFESDYFLYDPSMDLVLESMQREEKVRSDSHAITNELRKQIAGKSLRQLKADY